MNIYRAFYQGPADPAPQGTEHFATLAGARSLVRGWSKWAWPLARIELIDVPADKPGVLKLLNGYSLTDFAPLRTWALTARGGLREVANGE